MNYLTIKETARRWGVSIRTVNSLCAQGRVAGAVKFGSAWAIPEAAEKPVDPRRERKAAQNRAADTVPPNPSPSAVRVAMPLLNTPFPLGACMEAIEKLADRESRDIALAEYYYFSGQSEKVSALVEPYLEHEDIALQVSACWLYAYANIVEDRMEKVKRAMDIIRARVHAISEDMPSQEQAYLISVYTGASVLLHLPMPKILSPLKTHIHRMPPGLRLFVLYIQAHHAYLNKYYGTAIGIAETALALESELYPIPTIYLHLIACVAYLNMKHPEQAKEHFLAAWQLAQPDDLIQPIAEHHGLVGGTLEATLKRMFPEDFKRIIALTYKFSAGWRKIHNRVTGNTVTDILTTSEFAAAMLAARDWTNQEISAHMGISEYTVRHYISTALQKLHVQQRKDLAKYLLK